MVRVHLERHLELAIAENSQAIGFLAQNLVGQKALRSNFGIRRQKIEDTNVYFNPFTAWYLVEVMDFRQATKERSLSAFKTEAFRFAGTLTLAVVAASTGLAVSGSTAAPNALAPS